jgi:hypothetical protein
MTARSHFPTESIEAAIALIAEYDGRVRRQRGEAEKLVLEFFLYRLLSPSPVVRSLVLRGL